MDKAAIIARLQELEYDKYWYALLTDEMNETSHAMVIEPSDRYKDEYRVTWNNIGIHGAASKQDALEVVGLLYLLASKP